MQQNCCSRQSGYCWKYGYHIRSIKSATLYLYLCIVCIIALLSIFALSTSVTFQSGLQFNRKFRKYSMTNFTSSDNIESDLTKSYRLMFKHPSHALTSGTSSVNITVYNATTIDTPYVLSESSVQKMIEHDISAAFPQGGRESQGFKEILEKCADKNSSTTSHPISYNSWSFIITEAEACKGEVYLIIAVHSNLPNRRRRDLIRSSWASLRYVGVYRIIVMFFVGVTDNPAEQKSLVEESNYFHDIVQRNFSEHYRSLTYKHLTLMRWISEHCSHSKFMIKCDDDTFIDVFHVVHFLQEYQVGGFLCKQISSRPIRNPKSNMRKWLVTKEEYSKTQYPHYCEGFAYIMKAEHAKSLYWCSIFSKFFWIDDVHVTGTLREKLNIPVERFWTGHSWANMVPSYASDRIADVIFLRASHNEVMPEFWMGLWKSALKYNFT